jgi:hypothetical protein
MFFISLNVHHAYVDSLSLQYSHYHEYTAMTVNTQAAFGIHGSYKEDINTTIF